VWTERDERAAILHRQADFIVTRRLARDNDYRFTRSIIWQVATIDLLGLVAFWV
jgi:hypothetical protein